jgi:hypothetical protein
MMCSKSQSHPLGCYRFYDGHVIVVGAAVMGNTLGGATVTGALVVGAPVTGASVVGGFSWACSKFIFNGITPTSAIKTCILQMKAP